VIIVRHGRSTFNEQGRYQGSSDESVLTAAGIEAARQTGQFLCNHAIDAVYTSPLRRAWQTFSEIASVLDLAKRQIPVQVDVRLREVGLLAWEGLPFQQVRTEFAEDYLCWKQRPHEFSMPVYQDALTRDVSAVKTGDTMQYAQESARTHGLETSQTARTATATATPAPPLRYFPAQELYRRSHQFWREVLPQHVGKTLLLIGHGGSNHALIGTAIGLSAAKHHSLQQSNCGISLLRFRNGQIDQGRLDSLNLTQHLGECLPKLKEGKSGVRLLLLSLEGLSFAHVRDWASFLGATPIQLCLLPDDERAQTAATLFLPSQPQAVRLHTQGREFLLQWQKTLQQLSKSNQSSRELLTALAIAPRASIQSLLYRELGLPSHQSHALYLQPNRLQVLHYPASYHRPVLQAFNLSCTTPAS
jgi:broad specificity phosphatase PhoE